MRQPLAVSLPTLAAEGAGKLRHVRRHHQGHRGSRSDPPLCRGQKLNSVTSSGRDQTLVNCFALTKLTGAWFMTKMAIH